jgi:hypothetical protein
MMLSLRRPLVRLELIQQINIELLGYHAAGSHAAHKSYAVVISL